MDWREPVKAFAPLLALSWYRRARLVTRSLSRALAPVRTCRVRGLEIRLGVGSEVEQFRAESYADKEPETLDWLDQNLRDGDVFVDVGANIGLYSLYAAKRTAASVIYAVEPESQNFARLCRNIALNGLTNVIPCNIALSDREGLSLLYVSNLESGSALHGLDGWSPYRIADTDCPLRQGTIALTLDRLIETYGMPLPSMLKIDVDGIEEKILAGAAEALASSTLRTVLVEVTVGCEASSSWPERLLGRFGFELVRKSDWTAELHGLRSQNHVFSRYHAELGPVR